MERILVLFINVFHKRLSVFSPLKEAQNPSFSTLYERSVNQRKNC